MATTAEVAAALRRYSFRYANEDQLQQAIHDALAREGIHARREERLDSRSRIDLLAGRIGIEVKVAGNAASVLRQLRRYAALDSLDGLVLVTSRSRHTFPAALDGKPLEVVSLVLGRL